MTVLTALRMALATRCPPVGLLCHTDRGVQYASGEHRAVLTADGIEASMSRVGNPYDNTATERFMATYKRECVALAEADGGYATTAEATTDFFDYAERYYKRQRCYTAMDQAQDASHSTVLENSSYGRMTQKYGLNWAAFIRDKTRHA